MNTPICKRKMAEKMLHANDRGLSVETQKLIMSGACTFKDHDGPTLIATAECQHCGTCTCAKPAAKAAAPVDTRTPEQRLRAAFKPTKRADADNEGAEQ